MPRGDLGDAQESSEQSWDSTGKGPVGRGSLSDGQVLTEEEVGARLSQEVAGRCLGAK